MSIHPNAADGDGAFCFRQTEYGFQYGALTVERLLSNKKTGEVVISLETPRNRVQVLVTPSGLIRVLNVKEAP